MMDKLANQSDINLTVFNQLKDSNTTAKKQLESQATKIKTEAIKQAVKLENKCKTKVTDKYKKDQIESIKKKALMDLKLNSVNKLLNELKNSLVDLQKPNTELKNRIESECNQQPNKFNKFEIDDMLRNGKNIPIEQKDAKQQKQQKQQEPIINEIIKSINNKIDSKIVKNENECIQSNKTSEYKKCKNPLNINILYPHIKSPI